jgi:hypothetical protein
MEDMGLTRCTGRIHVFLANGNDNNKNTSSQWHTPQIRNKNRAFLIGFLAKSHHSFLTIHIVMVLHLVYMPGEGERAPLALDLEGNSHWREAPW